MFRGIVFLLLTLSCLTACQKITRQVGNTSEAPEDRPEYTVALDPNQSPAEK